MSENVTLSNIKYSRANRAFHNLPKADRYIALDKIMCLPEFDALKAKKIITKVKRGQ